jgi:hypothetical protein
MRSGLGGLAGEGSRIREEGGAEEEIERGNCEGRTFS